MGAEEIVANSLIYATLRTDLDFPSYAKPKPILAE